MNEDDQDRRLEFCEWFFHTCDGNVSFPDLIVWSDEATFKLDSTVNRRNWVYRFHENPHVTEQARNLQEYQRGAACLPDVGHFSLK
jgi:hypothetical protein